MATYPVSDAEIIEWARAVSGFIIADIADASMTIFLNVGKIVIESMKGGSFDINSLDSVILMYYIAGCAAENVHGPGVKEETFGDAKISYHKGKVQTGKSGTFQGNEFLDVFDSLLQSTTGLHLEKTSWSLVNWEVDITQNPKRYTAAMMSDPAAFANEAVLIYLPAEWY